MENVHHVVVVRLNNLDFRLHLTKLILKKAGLHCVGLLLLLVLPVCNRLDNQTKEGYSFDAVPAVDAERADTVKKEYLLTNPFDMLLIGDSLAVVSTMDKHYQFDVIHLHHVTAKRVGKLGMGPGEITFPTELFRFPGSSVHFMLNIRPRFKVCKVNIEEFINDQLNLSDCSSLLPTGFQKVVLVEDGIYVGFGLFPGRYAVANDEGKIEGYFGDYPSKKSIEIRPPYSIAMAYQGDIDIRPDGKRLVSTVEYGVILEVLEIDGKNLRYVSRILDAYPEFSDRSTENSIAVNMGPESIRGFIDIYTTQDFIAGLFSGKSRSKGEVSKTGNLVYIFDWEGEGRLKIRLPDDVLCIALDEELRVLYAITYGENPELIKYRLPDKSFSYVYSD